MSGALAAALAAFLSYFLVVAWTDNSSLWYLYIESGVVHANNIQLHGKDPSPLSWHGRIEVWHNPGQRPPWTAWPGYVSLGDGLWGFTIPLHWPMIVLLVSMVLPQCSALVARMWHASGPIKQWRIWRPIRWLGAALSLLLISAWIASLPYSVDYTKRYLSGSGMMYYNTRQGQEYWPEWRVRLADGAIGIHLEFIWVRPTPYDGTPINPWNVIRIRQRETYGFSWIQREYLFDDRLMNITIPIWMPLVLIALPTFFLWRWTWKKRFPPGHCRNCGYNLFGNVSGICPECETPVEKQDIPVTTSSPTT